MPPAASTASLAPVTAELEGATIGDGMFDAVVGDIHWTAADAELITGLEHATGAIAEFVGGLKLPLDMAIRDLLWGAISGILPAWR